MRTLLSTMLASLFILVLCQVHTTNAFSTGAPDFACDTMVPTGHGFPAQTTESPYTISVNPAFYRPGEALTVNISTNSGTPTLKGILLLARRVLPSSNDRPIIGSWSVGSLTDFQLRACSNGAGQAVTHTNSNDKSPTPQFTWTAPDLNGDDIFIAATFVQAQNTFWVAETTSNIEAFPRCCRHRAPNIKGNSTFRFDCATYRKGQLLGIICCQLGLRLSKLLDYTVQETCNMGGTEPCGDNGTCESLMAGGIICNCDVGYSGTFCEIPPSDPCNPNPCLFGGTCVVSGSTFTCNCPPLTSGSTCHFILFACDSNPCANGGTCTTSADLTTYTCNCPFTHTGPQCLTVLSTPCNPNPCLNGGVCSIRGDESFTCICPSTHNGTTCEIFIQTGCNTNPCLNGGDCTPVGSSGFSCTCSSGYTGTQCEIVQTGCNTNSCLNGGACTPVGSSSFSCTCPSGYTGNQCEIVQTGCNTNPCLNGGACTPVGSSGFTCTCPSGYTGTICQTLIQIGCNTNPCLNGGACTPVGSSGFSCTCPSGYTGTNCQTLENPCRSNPCQNGGRCIVVGDNQFFICQCASPYSGPTCTQNPCNPNPCLNGGVCSPRGDNTDLTCSCPSTHTGTTCEILKGNARCLNVTVPTDFGRVRLPVAHVGVRINSNETCPFEYSEAPDTPIIRAICQMSSNGTTYWNTSIQCDDSLTRQLENILQGDISEANRVSVAQELFILTQNSDDIGPRDITLLYEILQLIADLNSTYANVTDLIVGIVNNIMYVDEGVLASAQESGNFTTLIVQILESQLNTVSIGNSTLETTYPNIAVQVLDLPLDGAADGIVVTMFTMDTGDLRNSDFKVGTHQDTAFDSVPRDTFARVVVPIEVASVFTAADVTEGPSSSNKPSNGNILSTAAAPGVTSGSRNTIYSNAMDNLRIAFAVYVSDAMFPSESLTRLNQEREPEGVTRQVNTPVVSLTVGGQKIDTLMERVNMTFFRFEPDSRDPTCNFWEFSLGTWSMEGCQLLPDVNSVENLYYTCACDHLTNFAVLVDIYAADEPPKPVLRLLSIIGCAISCVCLVISILSYLSVKKVRGSQPHRIFICLCFTLLCLYIASLAIIALDREYQYAELEWIPCTVLAALVHYFVLSSLTWMGIEGFHTYLIFIRVFDTHIRHYMIKAAFVGWGIPAVIVGITGGITRNTYAIEDYCYIQQWPLIGGLLIPMAFILIINIIVFILAMCRLEHSARLPGRVKKDYKAQRQETLERIQNGIAILVLLGFTWTTGYLTLVNVDFADLLFIVSNSLQGFFIFALYCLRKATIRAQWRRCLCCALFREDGSAGFQGMSGQTPGSRPASGNGDSRPISEPSSSLSHTNEVYENNLN